MKFLVDTNVWSDATKSVPDSDVEAWIKENEALLYISSISIGELRFGIEILPEGKRKRGLTVWLSRLCKKMNGRTLSLSPSVAHIWGQTRARQREKGIRLPAINSQIAAVAKKHGMIVVTRNIDDFKNAGVRAFNPFPD